MIFHLLKKDLRRSRVLLAMWFLLIIAQFALIGSGVNPSDRVMQVAFQMISVLVPLFQGLLVLVIIPHVIHDEPLVGTTAFWFTRPISPALLLKGKALFALLILLLVPLLTEVIVLAANGVTAHDVALAVPEIVLSRLTFIIALALLAVVTPNFGRFAVSGAGCVIAFILVAMGVQWAKLFLHPESMMGGGADAVSLMKSRGVASSLLTILGGGAIVAHQYLTRRTARTIVAAVIGVAAVLAVQSYWPIDFLKPTPVDNAKAGFDVAAVKVGFDSAPVVSDAMSLRGKEVPEKRVQALFGTSGIPRGLIAKVKRVNAELRQPNGQAVPLKQMEGGDGNDYEIESLETALGGIPVVNADRRYFSHEAQLFLMDAAIYNANAKQPLVLKADIDLLISKHVVSGELPLKKGARYDHGSEHVVVTDVLRQPDGVDIILQQRKVNLLFNRTDAAESPYQFQKKVVYLLVNKKRREAVQQKQGGVVNLNITGSRLNNEPLRLAFGSSQNRSALLPELNEQWLADAVLVRLERVPVAEVTRPLMDENFIMSGDAAWWKTHKRRNDFSGASDKPDKEALAKIELPTNATKQQVKDYVMAVMMASKKQTSFDERDPQTDMLAKVGAQNLDVLIEIANRTNSEAAFYLWEAVTKLARPEDKEMVLAALGTHHDLIKLVIKNGWVADAKETLLTVLSKENGYLPPDWIKAIASLQDPATYPELTKYFIRHSGERKSTFAAIKNLPGLDLSQAVAEAWKRARFQSESEAREMIPIAAEYGNIEALDLAVKLLKGGSQNNHERKLASEALRTFTAATGDDRALVAWFEANRAKLTFDGASKKFVVMP